MKPKTFLSITALLLAPMGVFVTAFGAATGATHIASSGITICAAAVVVAALGVAK